MYCYYCLDEDGGARDKLSVKKSNNNPSLEDDEDSSSSSSEDEPSSSKGFTECQSFYIIVNADGSLSLDNSRQVVLGKI